MTLPHSKSLELAFSYYESGHYALSRKIVRKLDRDHSEIKGLAYIKGLLYLEEGNTKKASYFFKIAHKQSPDAIAPLFALSKVYQFREYSDLFIQLHHAIIALDPCNAETWNTIGKNYFHNQSYKKSYDSFLRSYRSQEPQFTYYNYWGLAAHRAGNHQKASYLFHNAIVKNPDQSGPYANLVGIAHSPLSVKKSEYLINWACRLNPKEQIHWVEKGQFYSKIEKYQQAKEAFIRAILYQPETNINLWLLGSAYLKNLETMIGLHWLKRLMNLDKEDFYGAQLILAHHKVIDLPREAPRIWIKALYDQYAPHFDQDLQNNLNYRGPKILSHFIKTHLETHLKQKKYKILDIGCGTGLSGEVLKELASTLDGVDLSKAMIEKARERHIYNRLLVDDMNDFMRKNKNGYDIIVCLDALIYQGDLSIFMLSSSHALHSQGYLIVTVEKSAHEMIALHKQGRYAHHADHLKRTGLNAGFQILMIEEYATRTELSEDVLCYFALFKKL
jgi:predicted TPR repeat methyltransferase/Tfp pilus assembly protein PilF